jgi:hypothetical protein
MTPLQLRVPCDVERTVAVNDQGHLKGILMHFDLLQQIISGMSKRNHEIHWKIHIPANTNQ